jgi:NADH:ubiquinone oxidoreductase subunit F (NADH-binding)/NADH:ubiquinone oxidoreductase subunit E
MIYDELRNLQREHGYLPAEQLRALSERVDVPLHRIHSVASFYPHFHLTRQAAARVGVCSDMSCHLRGADALFQALQRGTSGLGAAVSLKRVSCLGQCDRAPAICLNDRILAGVTAERACPLLAAAAERREVGHEHSWNETQTHASAVDVGRFASDPYPDGERYGAARQLLKTHDWDAVMRALQVAGVAGMGGAGFPTHIKWDTVRKAQGSEKFVVCNADESEPGTTKDRCILEFLPHLVIEGMMICAWITGAKSGYLYIRHEYERQKEILEEEIARCRQAGLLGQDIMGSGLSFDIELFVSPGGYICGEGSSLLEAIEGNRAEPRIRPPNSAIKGLFQKPTALNNVETFAQVPQVLMRGAQWYKAQGLTDTAAGFKFVSVSGDVRRPGVFEIRSGTKVSEVILGCAGGPPDGKAVKAFSPSGAASGFLPASLLDVKLDFKSMAAAGTMLGSGAIVVCAEGRCMIDMALNSLRFFRNESCGKCVPCRIGSQKMVEIVEGWTRGEGKPKDLAPLQDLSETLKQTSICGLGQFIPYSILTVLKHFRPEVEAHILDRQCPEGVCPMRA